jgi:stromal membrane-associated protein
VFVCLPCSGIHRNLGTHISKMKSANLDNWNRPWIDVMDEWGNARANAYWEANMPPGAK